MISRDSLAGCWIQDDFMDKSCPACVHPGSKEARHRRGVEKLVHRMKSACRRDWQRGEYCTGSARLQGDSARPAIWQGRAQASTKMISCARAGMFPAGAHHSRALKSCKRRSIALRSCPATQHFTHAQKYFEKMLARFQSRA
jgi:hypothetical protein